MRPSTADLDELYKEPGLYDLNFRNAHADIAFYVELAKEQGGPVLELCCGTGRITLPLAQAGFEVVGLDLFQPMLALGRKKAEEQGISSSQLSWIQADARDFDLGRKFSLVMIPFSSLQHFHDRESILAVFARVREHLADDGVFAFDILNPKFTHQTKELSPRVAADRFEHEGLGEQVSVEIATAYDHALQKRIVEVYYSTAMKKDFRVERIEMRCFYPLEIENLLHTEGFQIIERWGGYDRRPFDGSGDKQLILCRSR